jgi:hypothetical protein
VVDTHRGDFCEQFRTIGTRGGDNVKRLTHILVIVAILAIMIVPSLTGSYAGSTTIYSTKYFSYGSYYSSLYVSGYARAYEEPYRQVKFYVYVKTAGIIRIFPSAELYSEPGADQSRTNVLGKYYFDEEFGAGSGVSYSFTLKEDANSPAVFGRAWFGVAADAGPYGIVLDINFIDGQAPQIAKNAGLSTMLQNQIWQWQGPDPFGFY